MGNQVVIFFSRSGEVVTYWDLSLSRPFLGRRHLLRFPMRKHKAPPRRKTRLREAQALHDLFIFLDTEIAERERERGETQRRREEEKDKEERDFSKY